MLLGPNQTDELGHIDFKHVGIFSIGNADPEAAIANWQRMTLDGIVARHRREEGVLGSKLDIAVDRIVELVLWQSESAGTPSCNAVRDAFAGQPCLGKRPPTCYTSVRPSGTILPFGLLKGIVPDGH